MPGLTPERRGGKLYDYTVHRESSGPGKYHVVGTRPIRHDGLDKVTGRAKQAAGDLADDSNLKREGRQEERKGEAKDELGRAQERADAKADEVADLERKTK